MDELLPRLKLDPLARPFAFAVTAEMGELDSPDRDIWPPDEAGLLAVLDVAKVALARLSNEAADDDLAVDCVPCVGRNRVN